MADLKVTLVRSQIGIKPKHRGTFRALGLGKIGQLEHAAGPARDPRDDRPRAAPRHGRGDHGMKIHDLKPAPGSRRPRRRVGRGIGGKGGKTAGRGSKGQGARATVPAGLRGWPDAAAPPHAEGEGVQQPVPRRVPRREPRGARAVRRGCRGDPRHAARARSRAPSGASSRCSARGELTKRAHGPCPRRSRSAATGRSRPPAGPSR